MKIDMITGLGYPVDYSDFTNTYIDIDDIYLCLPNIYRYNGAVQWSLLQHSVLVAMLAEKFNGPVLTGFCAAHDFHEVYIGDMTSGLKKHVPRFREMEMVAETHVLESIGLPIRYRDEAIVKKYDLQALFLEMEMLGHPGLEAALKNYGGQKAFAPQKTTFAAVAQASEADLKMALKKYVRDARIAIAHKKVTA